MSCGHHISCFLAHSSSLPASQLNSHFPCPGAGAEHSGVDASMSWAAVGALAGLPLVWLKQWSWSPAATQSLPALEDMHRTRLQIVAPWLQRMSRAHVAAVMACEVVPMTLLLLPAAQSVIAAWSSVAASLPPLGPAVQEAAATTAATGAEPRETMVRLAGLLLTATLAAIGQGTELSPSEEEFEVSFCWAFSTAAAAPLAPALSRKRCPHQQRL